MLSFRIRNDCGVCSAERVGHNEPMLSGPFIVVSGLPASGKTAVGRYVARKMCLPLLDKDDFLEREFEKYSSVDLELRQQLSRKSDEIFATEAIALGAGTLVTFWRPTNLNVSYGTATDWFSELRTPVVELFCRCDPCIARKRFVSRTRHSGHNDALRLDGLARQFQELALLGPLGNWPVATIDTSDLNDIATLGDEAVRSILELLNQNC
jgi:predicted kinase